MAKISKFKKKIKDYFFDHRITYEIVSSLIALFFCALSGFLFAFGYTSFISVYSKDSLKLVTGGASGLSQNIVFIFKLCGFNALEEYTLQSILYFIINVPLFVFAFFRITKRFAIFSLLNVGFSSLFIQILSSNGFAQTIASNSFIVNSTVSRALFAGACTGVSSSLAFVIGISCGGIDIITYYVAMKKSTSVGKYGVAINSLIILLYTCLTIIENPSRWSDAILLLLFSILYLFVVGLVTDAIHRRNKKVKIEIVTSKSDMSNILITIFPHSATIFHATGAYSYSEKFVINMIVSSNEERRVVAAVRKIDPESFVSTTNLHQVYGNFFTRPIE